MKFSWGAAPLPVHQAAKGAFDAWLKLIGPLEPLLRLVK